MKQDPAEALLGALLSTDMATIERLCARLDAEERLMDFVRMFWHIVEPGRPLVDGWAMEAIADHLQAVADGHISNLIVNVPPGFSKSLLTNVFFPAWLWGPRNQPSLRFMAFSYSQALTIRDNIRFRQIIMSPEYREHWGDRFGPSEDSFSTIKVANNKTGWKLASSVGGLGTGERADIQIIDDPNNVQDVESDTVRNGTNQWLREVAPTRFNDMTKRVRVLIQQRTHENDATGVVLDLEEPDAVHLMIPMEYDPGRHCETVIGWQDPRTVDGELAWPERFTHDVVTNLKKTLGPYAAAGQLQQAPTARGGGIFNRQWWQPWEHSHYPRLEYVLASADTAYTERTENDWSALTIWGIFKDDTNTRRVLLMYAWRDRLELNKLVIKIGDTCRRLKVDRLLIESKASGISAAQEMRRLFKQDPWGVELIDPKRVDKVARAYSVQNLFSGEPRYDKATKKEEWVNGLIHAPDKSWAQMVIDEMGSFPKGKWKDLTDSATQALRWYRLHGMIGPAEEQSNDRGEEMMTQPVSTIYPA